MARLLIVLMAIGVLASCRSARKIQTAITKKDTVVTVNIPEEKKNDTLEVIRTAMNRIAANNIDFKTFSAKVNADYTGSDGKKYPLNVVLRMYKDSAIWMLANASILNLEVMRALITKDSVKLLAKQPEKVYTARSLDYLQEVTALPLTLKTLQDLIIGNPVFLDSNIVSYSVSNNTISLLSLGEVFKHLITLSQTDTSLLHSKLDDADIIRNRTADLTYSDYENKKGVSFSTKRSITVAEKTKLDIKLDFKQYDFNQEVSFPFSVPKNYPRK
jgi:Domain of unknown function (DUF4292)